MSDLSDVNAILPVALYKKLQKQLEPIVEKIDSLEYATRTIEATPGPQGERGANGERGPQGLRGEIGPQGFRGEKGDRGEQGLQGIQGEVGPQGEKGDRGEQGLQGEVGPQGLTGETGPRGLSGEQGLQGEKGDRGEVGPQGLTGEKGERGETGLQGEVGPQGLTGEKGDRGEQGLQGEKGDRGEQGLQGIQGEIGPQGERGENGDRGEVGPQGETGPQGERGEQGIQGERGERGEVGPQGEVGPEGPPGKDATVPDINSIVEPFISNAQTNIDSYIDKSEKTFKNWQSMVNSQLSTIGGGGEVWLGRLNDVDRTTAKVDGAYLKYDASTKKWVGASGGSGSQGPKGDKGDPGEPGLPGADGADALWNYTGQYNGGVSYAVGDVAVYNGELFYRKDAHDGNTGDIPQNGSLFWDLIAAKGEQGVQGIQGIQGPQGLAGDKYQTTSSTNLSIPAVGTTITLTTGTGLSYSTNQTILVSHDLNNHIHAEIDSYNPATGEMTAVVTDTEGSGTYSSWIVNLSGAVGALGPQGPEGEQGPQGVPGLQGLTGETGLQGEQGIQGETGPQPSITVNESALNSITLSNLDNNTILKCTSSATVNVTVPSILADGFSCMVIQGGGGQIIFVAGSGTTLNSFGSLVKTAGQHAPASIVRLGAGIYNLSGNLI